MDEDSSTEQKTRQVYSFGKRSVFMLHLNESREGFPTAVMGTLTSLELQEIFSSLRRFLGPSEVPT